MWDGTRWVCDPDCDDGAPQWPAAPPCPPPSFPPAGCPPWFPPPASQPPWYPGANAGVSFGTTPPVNPIRGHFWWDGVRMWMWDGAVWVDIVASATGAAPGGGAGSSGIIGITDGSLAKPGYVGEYVQMVVAVPIPVTWNYNQSVSMGTLQPGDWTVQATLSVGTLVGGTSYSLSPVPAGVSNNMACQIGCWVTTAEAGMMTSTLTSPVARANITVPTLFVFSVTTNYLGGGGVIAPQSGSGSMTFTARRAR
jgi:hypothetical protein